MMCIPKFNFIDKISLLVLSVILCSSFLRITEACNGGYFTLAVGQSRTVNANNYEAYTNCIWVVEAPDLYKLSVTINFFQGVRNSLGECADYIQAKDGAEDASQSLDITCDTMTSFSFNTSARWLWFQFKADGQDNNGSLSATIEPIFEGSSLEDALNPLKACKTHQYACSNMICLSRSVLCDGFNDCGCNEDCDEGGCPGWGFTKLTWISFSVGAGVGIFLFVFMIVYIYERRRRNIAIQRERMDRLGDDGRKAKTRKVDKDKKDKKEPEKDSKKKKKDSKKKDVNWVK